MIKEGQISEQELENFLGELSKAQQDGYSWGFLQKGDKHTRNVEALGKEIKDATNILGGRAIYHLNRLLSPERSLVERNFAENLAKFCLDNLSSLQKIGERQVRKVLSSEGEDVCLWWTLSPYLFAILRQKIGDEQAINKTLTWAKTGKSLDEVKDGHAVNLTGLDRYNWAGNNNTFTLGKDSNGNSHKFAQSEANRLVREVPLFK